MSKTVLITRPIVQAEKTAAAVRALGFEVVIEPMLSLRGVAYQRPDLSGVDGLVFTSANGVAFFDFGGVPEDFPMLCVGEDTAAAVRALGFLSVRVGAAGGENLAGLLEASGRYIHVRGRDVRYEFDVSICTPLVVYEAVAAERFSEGALGDLKAGRIDLVMLYSARTAQAFLRCVLHHECAHGLKEALVLSIYEDVLECVRVLPWRDTYIAHMPNGDGMMERLKNETI